jgi:hypothetical protein
VNLARKLVLIQILPHRPFKAFRAERDISLKASSLVEHLIYLNSIEAIAPLIEMLYDDRSYSGDLMFYDAAGNFLGAGGARRCRAEMTILESLLFPAESFAVLKYQQHCSVFKFFSCVLYRRQPCKARIPRMLTGAAPAVSGRDSIVADRLLQRAGGLRLTPAATAESRPERQGRSEHQGERAFCRTKQPA